MKKYYFFFTFLTWLLISFNSYGQTQNLDLKTKESHIENLSVFPNPVNQGKIYITSKENAPKRVDIYNVLGKHILTFTLLQKELNIASLKAGVYMIKITENNKTATRKLIVR